jgi:hypothetical protein
MIFKFNCFLIFGILLVMNSLEINIASIIKGSCDLTEIETMTGNPTQSNPTPSNPTPSNSTPGNPKNGTLMAKKSGAFIQAGMEVISSLLNFFGKIKENKKQRAEEQRTQCCKFQELKVSGADDLRKNYCLETLVLLDDMCRGFTYFEGTCSLSARLMSNFFILILALILSKLFTLR